MQVSADLRATEGVKKPEDQIFILHEGTALLAVDTVGTFLRIIKEVLSLAHSHFNIS